MKGQDAPLAKRHERWRTTPKQLFQIATSEGRDLHLTVLSLFADRDLTDPTLTLEALLRALPRDAPELTADSEQVQRSLRQLVAWRLLDESRNDAAQYRTPEEFRHRNLQWSLTEHGQTAVAALDAAAAFLASVASLQPAAIDSIALAIAEVVRLVEDNASDDVKIFLAWQQVEMHHQSLVENVRQFQRRLATLLYAPDVKDAVLAQARDAVVEYLTRYIQDAEQPALRARNALARLHGISGDGAAKVLSRALAGANLAPDPIAGDPAPRWLRERRRRLSALNEWFFRTADGSAPRMTRLRRQGGDWVLQFLRILALRRAHRRRSAGVIDDFVAMARAFSACTTDNQAHLLYGAGFAMHGARHHSVAYEGFEPLDDGSKASDNPPVVLSTKLRQHHASPKRKRARAVPDPRAARRRIARKQAEQAERITQLRGALTTTGVVPLSSYGFLEQQQYRELVDLLCTALATPPLADGTRQLTSSDGRVEVVVHAHVPHTFCQLVTSNGTLSMPDYHVSIQLRTRAAGQSTPSLP